jgi:1-acyl-sn-glycerol-3-phosphate acyltransferase
VFYLIPTLALFTVVLGTMSLISGVFDSRGIFAHRCAQWWSRLLLWTAGVRIERRGVLPDEGSSCIFVANHSSHYDTPILFTSLPRQLRIIAKATLRHVPFVGWHLARAGHLLIDRKNPGAGVLKRMQKMTTQGASLIVYPEGARTRDGRVMKFKGGVFLLAIDNGWPIVPVSVSGSRAVMPRGRLMVCPATVRVTVHDAIPTTGMTREDARSLAERAREIVSSGTEEFASP